MGAVQLMMGVVGLMRAPGMLAGGRPALVGGGSHPVRQIRASADVDVLVCTDSLCESLGAEARLDELKARDLGGARVYSSGCLGRCGLGVQICVEDRSTRRSTLCESVDEVLDALVEMGSAPGAE